jgi:hypothetical protein
MGRVGCRIETESRDSRSGPTTSVSEEETGSLKEQFRERAQACLP